MRRATQPDLPPAVQLHNFYPRSPCGERRAGGERSEPPARFLSTLSLRRATSGISAILTNLDDFYPRSPCGERPLVTTHADLYVCISIHALLAESDIHPPKVDTRTPISIHALLAESDRIAAQTVPAQTPISIHALLAESDGLAHCATVSAVQISIHALLAESDVSGLGRAARPGLFLSTLSLRRATRNTS